MSADVPDMDERVHADMNDGVTARRYAVDVIWGASGIALAGESVADTVAWENLTWIDTFPEAILLGRTDRPGWRMRLPADAPAGLVSRLPQRPRFGRWIDRFGLGKSLIVCAGISSLVAFVAVNTPAWLGRRIPVAWETGMSDDGLEDLSANTCHTPASDKALAKLAAMLDRDNKDGHLEPVRIELIKLDIVNAVALPGGRVLVFDGLAKQVQSPDALAGVIAHEIGHVRQRHVMQAMLREFGISMILSGFKSGVTNTLGRMTALRYSREAETEADDWARASLSKADISPVPAAVFLEGTAEQSPDTQFTMAEYLNSHPDPIGRADAFRAASRPDRHYRTALDDAEFAAVHFACEEDGKAKTWMARPI